jgi:hypothetical protein
MNPIYRASVTTLLLMVTLLTVVLCDTRKTYATGDGLEGIKVHGRWEITVANPDGRVVQIRRFANRLFGANQLASLLRGEYEVTLRDDGTPAWDIDVDTTGTDSSANCLDQLEWDAANSTTATTPSNTTPRNAAASQISSGFSLARQLQLPPVCVLGSDYSIDGVATRFDLSPRNGGTGGLGAIRFTSKSLDQPVTGIMPDQIVTLKVEISFE